MNTLHQSAFRLRDQLLSKQTTPGWTDSTKEKLINDFTYHSTKIEGLTLNYGDTLNFLRKGIVRGHENLKDITDLTNHREVLRGIFDFYEDMELNVQTIKDLHRQLMHDPIQWSFRNAYSGGPGEFKRENNFGYRGEEEKEYMDWMLVPKALSQLCQQVNEMLKDEQLTIEAIHHFHFQFANHIHPFGDGNGRLARLLHNLLLLKNRFPVVVIKASEKSRYLKAIISQEKEPEGQAFNQFLSKKLIESLETRLVN